MGRWLKAWMFLSACSSDPPPLIETFVEVQFNHGVGSDGQWGAGVDGRAGIGEWRRNGPRLETGTCVTYRYVTETEGLVLPAEPALAIEGAGTYQLQRHVDGDLTLKGPSILPSAPFVTSGTTVELRLEDHEVIAAVPERPELVAPAAGSAIPLQDAIDFQWTSPGADAIEIVVALFTDASEFRGALKCNAPDTGSFEGEFAEGAPADVTQALVRLTAVSSGRTIFATTQLELFVRQFSHSLHTISR